MRHTALRHAWLFPLLALPLACGSGEDETRGQGGDASGKATITGRVMSSGGALSGTPVEGATITAFSVENDGSLVQISPSAAKTDAQGRYTLNVAWKDKPLAGVVVKATEIQDEMSVLISDEFNNEDKIQAAPMSIETTVEADVYVQANVAGDWNETSDTVLLRNTITPQIAQLIKNEQDYESAVKNYASGVVAGLSSWRTMLVHESVGVDESILHQAIGKLRDAMNALDRAFDEASDESDRENARSTYNAALDKAFADEGITVEQRASAYQAMAEAMEVYFSELSQESQARVLSEVEAGRAELVAQKVENQFNQQDVNEQIMNDIDAAGTILRDAISAAAETGEDAQNRIASAWGEYRTAVEIALDAVTEETQMTAYNNVKSSVNNARGTLLSALDALQPSERPSNTATHTVNAFGDYLNTVFARANLNALTGAGIGSENARAKLEVLGTIYATPEKL